MYSGGHGTAQDNVQAHKWFSIASELGDYNAASRRDELAARMPADEIAESELLVKTWMERYATLQANQ
jgi:TPR repeat protein